MVGYFNIKSYSYKLLVIPDGAPLSGSRRPSDEEPPLSGAPSEANCPHNKNYAILMSALKIFFDVTDPIRTSSSSHVLFAFRRA